jgi:hypothetical protein
MSLKDIFGSNNPPDKYSKEMEIINSLPAYQRKEIISDLENRYSTELYQDPFNAAKGIRSLENKLDNYLNENNKREKGFPLINSSTSILGYEPAGSVLRKLYPNPFAVYSFIGNNHWATLVARMAVREDIARDGYVLLSPEGASKKNLKKVQTMLDDLYIDDFRLNAADMLNVYGNCWIDRDRNLLGGLKGIQLLLPEKILPILDTYGDFVLGWEYVIGNKRFYFNLGELDHLKTFNLRSMQLGNPGLAPVVVDVEADLYASIYANMMFQKGGLVRAIVSLGDHKDSPDDASSINMNTGLHFSQKVYELFSRQYSGVRGANQLTFLPNVKNVYPVTNPKDLEGPYKETSDRTAAKLALLLGVSPRRLGVHLSSQYENRMAVEDAESLSADNHRFYLTNIVDTYINNVIIKKYLGIDDVELKFSGEYSSLSINAAEFGLKIAQMGVDCVTVDEFRTRALHWEPLGGKEGAEFLGSVKNASMLMKGAANAGKNKDYKEVEMLLQKAVGPKNPSFIQSYEGKTLIKYKPRDVRMMKVSDY